MKLLVLIVLIVGCANNSEQVKIAKPPDMQEIIEEIKENKELQKLPSIQKRILDKIEESNNYNTQCYDDIQKINKRLSDLEQALIEKDAKIAELELELRTWRNVKIVMATLAFGLLLIGLIRLVIKYRSLLGLGI